jgi:hypothetical protein
LEIIRIFADTNFRNLGSGRKWKIGFETRKVSARFSDGFGILSVVRLRSIDEVYMGSFVLMSLWSVLLVLPATIFFSKREVVFNREKTDSFTKRYLIMGLFAIEQHVKFDIYTLFILRTVRKSYRLNQASSLVYKGNTMDVKDSYLAIQGKKKNDMMTYEICKGTQAELNQIIEHFILPKKIPVFVGVPKKGFEYQPKNDHSAKT